jgi:hypothetical protein
MTIAPAAIAQDVSGSLKKTTHLTFSGPVSLPNVTLPAGTYVFRFVDVNGTDVLQVLSDDGKTAYAMFNTIPIERAKSDPQNAPIVTFKETPAGTPAAIDAWFFDDTSGCEVVYN